MNVRLRNWVGDAVADKRRRWQEIPEKAVNQQLLVSAGTCYDGSSGAAVGTSKAGRASEEADIVEQR